MTLELHLPPDIAAALGNDPEREALEALLLHWVFAGKVTLAWAGERLGLNRHEALEWYSGHGYPSFDERELELDIRAAKSRLALS